MERMRGREHGQSATCKLTQTVASRDSKAFRSLPRRIRVLAAAFEPRPVGPLFDHPDPELASCGPPGALAGTFASGLGSAAVVNQFRQRSICKPSQTVANRDSAVGHCVRSESAADDRAEATAQALRDRLELNGYIRVAGRPAWRRILPGRVRDERLRRSILLTSALRRGDDRCGGGPHDEPLPSEPTSSVR
jgi:hypothetical protein